VTAEPVVCAESGDEIDPPESAVRMARDDAGFAGVPHRSRLVLLDFHVDCAPAELVGAWVVVSG
jgi:hypothetical protein